MRMIIQKVNCRISSYLKNSDQKIFGISKMKSMMIPSFFLLTYNKSFCLVCGNGEFIAMLL